MNSHTELEKRALELFNTFPECVATCFPAVNIAEDRCDLWHANNRPLPQGWSWVRGHGPASPMDCKFCKNNTLNISKDF